VSAPDPRLAVLTDLDAEGAALDRLVSGLDVAGWRLPTPAEGWDVATTVAHLAWTDEVAVIAATDDAGWTALLEEAAADPQGIVDRAALAGGAAPPGDLLARWRASRSRLADVLRDRDPARKIPWFGPPMGPTSMATARSMESWAHGLDVADAVGVTVEPHDRVRHVVHLGVRTRGFSFVARGTAVPEAEVRVELTAPGGDPWSFGPEDAPDRVTGSAWDFALLVTQRAHRADLDLHAEGAGADAWLDVAQAFAGPPGAGRPPRKVV
jgi:uncharacterized protein (TIGR03084 family)